MPVLTKSYSDLPFCQNEILRYLSSKSLPDTLLRTIDSCIEEAKSVITYNVCYLILPLTCTDDVCDLSVLSLGSKDLSKCLSGCRNALLFAATLGTELDRIIAKYGKISPARALILSAIGTAQTEELCNRFCSDMQSEYGKSLTPRYSPGYGDLPVLTQSALFSVLECQKKIGLYLLDSMLMSPSKSVTAIAGFCDAGKDIKENKCSRCTMTDCRYRGEL